MKWVRVFLFGCAAAAAFCAASLVRDQHNTFEKYPEWASAKTELALGVVGARSFTVTPVTMLGRALNLAAWHGNQEAAFLEPWEEFPEIQLRIYTEGSAEFTVRAVTLEGLYDFAFRISSDPLRPTAWLRVGENGIFMNRWLLDYRLPESRWVELRIAREGNMIVAYADHVKLGQVDAPDGTWRISLRADSSKGVARMDDLLFRSPKKTYEQSFSGSFPYGLAVALATALFVTFLLLEKIVGSRPAFSTGLFFAVSGGFLVLLHPHTLGKQYPKVVNLGKYGSNIETREQAMERLKELPKGKAVLLWLGGSQAWGAGASLQEKSVFGKLNEQFAGSKLELLNGAISGATLEDQLELLRVVSTRRAIKAVVITAGVNDAMNTEFPAKLSLLHSAVTKRGARLLLVPEPMKLPVSPSVKSRHDELKAFAREKSVPIVDLPAVFEERGDAGFLWWDFVHLSDAGAEIAAAALVPKLREIIEGP